MQMSKETDTGRILVLIAGAVLFGLLMALRGEASSLLVRAAIAALAFAVGAAALVYFMRRGG
jgi:hypothetical protein